MNTWRLEKIWALYLKYLRVDVDKDSWLYWLQGKEKNSTLAMFPAIF